jgi:hypothetical protein
VGIFEGAASQADTRPRDALEGARAFARAEARIGPVRALAAAAHAAARSVTDPAAVAAARAAGHAAATAHMGAHARGASSYAALALALVAPDDPDTASAAVRRDVEAATPAVRAALARLPVPPRASSRLATLQWQLHEAVSASD